MTIQGHAKHSVMVDAKETKIILNHDENVKFNVVRIVTSPMST